MRRAHPTGRGLTRGLAAAAAATLAVSLAACASSDRGSESTTTAGANQTGTSGASGSAGTGGGTASDTLIFGAAGAPSMFDPLYATDGETFRVARQINEGLIRFKPGTADPEAALATSWESSADGKTWTFTMRDGAKFQDGTPVDAAAACFNLDRMYNQTGAGATQAQYWSDIMGGFKDQKDATGAAVPSVYSGCQADGNKAVITLTTSTSKFPGVLGLPSYSIQSPTALQQYDANNVQAQGDSFVYPAYATEHPTGAGPYKFQAYDKANNTVTLVRNDDYYGEKAKTKTLIFKIIPDETARKQELQAGTIDGYDFPNPADWTGLKDGGFQVQVRPAFNIMYLGLTQGNNPALADLRVRQAIAHAVNRQQFVTSQLPEGATVANIFYPDTVDGFTDDVTKYDYDVDKAKSLLAEAGQSNLTLNFWWPTEVSRPYMPDPKSVFTAFKADLEAAGITVKETSKPWNGGYLDGVEAHQADVFLLGWTGDYNTPDNFIGTFFTRTDNRFNTGTQPWGAELSDALKAADAIPDKNTRDAAYVDLNKKIAAEYLPAIPVSSSPPAIVVAGNVQGLVPSPLTDERFASVSKTG